MVMSRAFRTCTGTVCTHCDGLWVFRTAKGTVCTLCDGLWVFRTAKVTFCALCGDVCGFSAHPQVQFVPGEVMSVGFPHVRRYSLYSVW